ncbi:MAG: HAMP domain-containing sensor histidine kinase [Sphaerochaetaceae bacterium]|nr:HAMP domain-containing sensor histidine kinase [Sphaerochaetaceae bacterium]
MMVVTCITIVIFSKKLKALLPILYYSSFILLLGTFFIYFLKIGGFPYVQKKLIFGGQFLFRYLTNVPMSFNVLGSLMIFGRMGFCLFFFVDALNHNYHTRTYLKSHRYMYAIVSIPLTVLTGLVLPSVFSQLFAYEYASQRTVITIVDIAIYLHLSVSLGLYVYEYFDIKLSFVKKQHGTLTIAMISLAIQYLFFASFEPITVYQNYSSIRIGYSFLTGSGSQAVPYWTAILSLCIFSTLVTLFSTWKYYKYDYDREKKEFVIKDKIDSAGLSSSILIHGFKNQLLSSEILCNRLGQEIHQIEDERLRSTLSSLQEKLSGANAFMRERLEILYQSFIDVNTKLVPVVSETLIDLISEKVAKKTQQPVITYTCEHGIVIADAQLLSEAVYNLVANALEAVEKVQHPKVAVDVKFLRARTLISISDNGLGIPKTVRARMFMPFNTTKNSLTNWGLGLCYSQMIVKKHLGEIRYETKIGEGTVMYISLPKYKGST